MREDGRGRGRGGFRNAIEASGSALCLSMRVVILGLSFSVLGFLEGCACRELCSMGCLRLRPDVAGNCLSWSPALVALEVCDRVRAILILLNAIRGEFLEGLYDRRADKANTN